MVNDNIIIATNVCFAKAIYVGAMMVFQGYLGPYYCSFHCDGSILKFPNRWNAMVRRKLDLLFLQ